MVTCENFASWFRNLESTFASWDPLLQVEIHFHKLQNQLRMLGFTATTQLPSTLIFARWSSNFARCEILSPLCENFAHLIPKCEIGTQRAKIGYFFRLFFFWYFLCLNFHFLLVFNYSCNSLARKYPRKGKTTFLYKFSCNHWKDIFRGAFSRRPMYISYLVKYIDLFCFLFLSTIFYFLGSQTPSEDVFPEDERLNQ